LPRSETLVSRSGTLIGSDKAGNKYYENRAYQIGAPACCSRSWCSAAPELKWLLTRSSVAGRHRWVVYADQTGYSAASVGSDWHGWLHNVYDNPPSRSVYLHPAYEVPAASGLYGSRRHCGASSMEPGETHLPKGHLKRGRKVWTRFAAWTGAPPAATAAAA